MDTLSSSNSNSNIVNGEKCSVSEEQWKAEEAIGGNAQALQALRELIVFPLLYSREAQKLGLKVSSFTFFQFSFSQFIALVLSY